MTWVDRNRAHLENIRTYVAGFGGHAPSVFAWFAGGKEERIPLAPESDRGTALLLAFCALYQNTSERRLMGLIASLWDAYGADFLKLNKLPFEELQARIDAHPGLADWAIRKQAPGILRSVCDFFYKHGKPLAWAESTGDAEACVEILSEEIFMMGKTSFFKPKARYFLWLLTQLPGAQPAAFWGARMRLPITPGHMRFLREFGPLQGRKRVPWHGPEEKIAYVNRFMRLLSPEAPWSAYAPLDMYLKPAAGNTPGTPPRWQCRDALGGCLNCPLAPSCPGREEF